MTSNMHIRQNQRPTKDSNIIKEYTWKEENDININIYHNLVKRHKATKKHRSQYCWLLLKSALEK